MDLSKLILTDIFYKNNAGEYELRPNNELIENDLNKIIDDLYPHFDHLMLILSQKRPFLAQYDMQINYYELVQVFHKFTRDVFGPRRLKAVLKKLPNNSDISDNMKKFGLKMNSDDPNIHRRVAYFFYWFGVYKPFSLVKGTDAQDIEIPEKHKFIIKFFNEIITYSLIQMVLASCVFQIENCPQKNKCKNKKAGLVHGDCFLTINIDQNENIFEIFLSRLHNNKLNRSSLELLLSNSYIFSKCRKNEEPCLLKKYGFYKWRTFD
ncbi:hypothetical protein R84B8_01628 [Treponema sp. R8-4-B8]